MTPGARVDHRLWLVGMIALGAGLRLYRLGDHSLWVDEGITYLVASAGSLGELLERQGERTFHPPLGFLLNHLALQIQDSDAMLRLPSALLGTLTIPLMYLLARRLAWPTAALVATAILTVSPFHLWHSQDARAYVPLLLVNVASTLVLLWAMAGGRARVGGVLYALTAALGLYLHTFAILPIMVHGLWLLLWRRRWLPWLILAVAGALVLAAPVTLEWATFVAQRLTMVASGVTVSGDSRANAGLAVLPYTLYVFAAGYSFGPDLAALHGSRNLASLGRFWMEISVVALLFGGLLTAGAIALRRRIAPVQLTLVALGLMLPLLLALVITAVTRFAFNVRYVIAAYPYFCILLGAGVAPLIDRRAVLGWVVAGMVIALSLWSWSNYLTDPRFAKEDLRGAVQAWRTDRGGDQLFSLWYAGGARDVIDRYLAPDERSRHVPVGRQNVAATIEAAMTADGDSTAHVIITRDWGHRLEDEVTSRFEVRHARDFPGVRLLEIVRSDSSGG